MTTLTTNYRFTLPVYDSAGWDTLMNNNLVMIDSILGQFNTGLNLAGLWTNGTAYVAGQTVVDGLTGFLWTCAVNNTSSPAPMTLTTEAANNPGWWTNITNPATTAAASALAAASSATTAAISETNATAQVALATTQATNAATSATAAATSAAQNSVLSTFRNRLINGTLDVNQRAGSPYSCPTATATYTVDRWICNPTGFTATATLNAGTAYGSKNYVTLAGSVPSGSSINWTQRIEGANCYDLVGKQVTVQFACSYTLSVGSMAFTANLYYAGTLDTFTSPTLIQSISFTPTSTPGLYTATFNALPSQAANGLQFTIQGTQSGATGTLALNLGTLSLEPGAVANTFERRPYGVEKALCQQYYQTVHVNLSGFGNTSNAIAQQMPLSCTMHHIPTPTILTAGSNNNLSGVTHDSITVDGFRITATITSTGPALYTGELLALSAEL